VIYELKRTGQGWNDTDREKPVPVPLCRYKNPTDRQEIKPAETGWRPTVWTMAQSN